MHYPFFISFLWMISIFFFEKKISPLLGLFSFFSPLWLKLLHASIEVILWIDHNNFGGYMKVPKWASCCQAAVRLFNGRLRLFRFKSICWPSKSFKRRPRSIQERTSKWSGSCIGSWSLEKSWKCWRLETTWNSTCREWWRSTG